MRSSRFSRELLLPAAALMVLVALLWWFGVSGHSPASDPYADHHPPELTRISLTLNKGNLWQLRLKREEALRRGVLITEENDWVKAKLHEGTNTWPVSLRLKGDWTDHLKGGKWSFRVRMRQDTAYRGMTVFSLQNPETRDFLSEWLFHQVLREEGVLSPRYDFVRLSLNGSDLGVYALEEHFTKQLLESQGRREGPLLKFNEDGMWEARVEALRDTLYPYLELPIYEAAQPEAFQTARYLKSDSSKVVLGMALSLMHQYKHGLAPTEQLFDLDQVARQYALTDLFHGHHSLVWHNRRFAFNPITLRLEPVVYDAFAGKMSGMYINGPFTGYAANGATSYGRREDLLGTGFFENDGFVEDYYRYLWRFTDPEFIKNLKDRYEADWKKREGYLRREFLGYRFDFGEIEENGKEIQQAMYDMRWRDVKVEETGNNRVCVQNYAPVAVVVRVGTSGTWKLLGAYDGVAGAIWTELDWAAENEVRFRVAGAPSEMPDYIISRLPGPR